MAIQWGGWSNRLRVGVEWWVTSGPDSGGRVNIHTKIWMQTDYSYYDYDGTANVSGAMSRSFTRRLSGGAVILMGEWDDWFTANYGARRTISVSVNGTSTGAGPAGASSSLSLPARPYLRPRPPKNAKAVWVADRRARVTWTGDYDGANGPQPWANVRVVRYTGSDKTWRTVATLGWNATSWDDTSAPLNEHTEYTVFAVNEAGRSDGAWGGTVNTRPTAPTNVQAVKQSSGDIQVTWDQNSTLLSYITSYTIFDSGTQVGTVSGGTNRSWTHSSPNPAVSHQYTVFASTVNPSLMSAASAPSNVVVILAPPNAPMNLAPNGSGWAIESGDPVLTWAHNPVDTSAQTRAEVQWRPAGGTWVTVPITGTAQKLTLTGVGAGSYEWQARTQGAYHPGQADGWSPWSAVATFTLVNVPGVAISVPGEGTYTQSAMTAEWSYYQAQSHAQTAAQVQVTSGDQTLVDQTLQGAVTSWAVPWTLLDGQSYTVRVRARSSDGLWSPWDQVSISVTYPSPPAPQVSVEWDDTMGMAQVTIANPAPVDPQPSTVTNTVERSIDGGASWELVASDLPLNATITDPECLVGAPTLYRVTAISALPSSAATTVELVVDSPAMWLSGGDGFTTVVRLPYNPSVSITSGLVSREVQRFAGRTLGVEMAGTARQRTVSIGSLLIEEDPTSTSSTSEDVEALSYLPAPILYRDPTGRRIYTSMQRPDLSRDHLRRWTLSVTLEEVDRDG